MCLCSCKRATACNVFLRRKYTYMENLYQPCKVATAWSKINPIVPGRKCSLDYSDVTMTCGNFAVSYYSCS